MKNIFGFLLMVIALQSQAATTQYITNGGFETGDFSGWTVTNIVAALKFRD
ncbi:hypothetical protein [Methylomonas rivi]|uniref:Uncharacterized protein n=1 Tax=Methylomonas rivi TaxID=2952226 RepID=A0ABT1UCB4_9GAMM|nr:hypothetical protein [Methylomonas sp. WSC-6]MCQ8130731.1 hypothetical protein [Methylomonas sp. WSC-6]